LGLGLGLGLGVVVVGEGVFHGEDIQWIIDRGIVEGGMKWK
jgi:hypothetical protein